MGIFWPTFMVARWPSVARMLGFCRMRVSTSVRSALAVAGEMLTAKLLALRWASELRVKLEVVVPFVVVVVLVVVVLVVGVACGVMVMEVGRVMPRFRILSLLTSR